MCVAEELLGGFVKDLLAGEEPGWRGWGEIVLGVVEDREAHAQGDSVDVVACVTK